MDAAAWDDRYRGWDYVWALEPNRFVEEHALPLEPGRALDLAAGEGRNAVWLAGRGWDVTAVDFSPVGIEKADRLASDHGVAVRTEVADLRAYPIAPSVWDLVLLSYVQLPTDDRLDVVSRAAAGVAPGGTLLVVAHDRSNLERGFGGPHDIDVLYDVDETVAAAVPLTPAVATVVGRPVTKDGVHHVAFDTVVVARA